MKCPKCGEHCGFNGAVVTNSGGTMINVALTVYKPAVQEVLVAKE